MMSRAESPTARRRTREESQKFGDVPYEPADSPHFHNIKAAAVPQMPVEEIKEEAGLPAPPLKHNRRGSFAPALESEDEFKRAILARHNELRAKHGAPPLEWSDHCAANAQLAVNKCQADDQFASSHCHEYQQGQNVREHRVVCCE